MITLQWLLGRLRAAEAARLEAEAGRRAAEKAIVEILGASIFYTKAGGGCVMQDEMGRFEKTYNPSIAALVSGPVGTTVPASDLDWNGRTKVAVWNPETKQVWLMTFDWFMDHGGTGQFCYKKTDEQKAWWSH